MGQLALIWDGTWLTWSAHDAPDTISRREISSPSMVKEVLKALRKQVAPGTAVIHGEWARPATAIPSALLTSPWEKETLTKLHETQHGPIKPSFQVQLHALDALDDHPCLAVEGDLNWEQSLVDVFPHARRVPVIRALVHDALQLNRRDGHHGWTFRADVRAEGAVMVALAGEHLQWVHHLNAGCSAEDALYAMVNAAHRAGVGMETCRTCWSGEEECVHGWSRFMEVQAVSIADSEVSSSHASHASWRALLQSMKACA